VALQLLAGRAAAETPHARALHRCFQRLQFVLLNALAVGAHLASEAFVAAGQQVHRLPRVHPQQLPIHLRTKKCQFINVKTIICISMQLFRSRSHGRHSV